MRKTTDILLRTEWKWQTNKKINKKFQEPRRKLKGEAKTYEEEKLNNKKN